MKTLFWLSVVAVECFGLWRTSEMIEADSRASEDERERARLKRLFEQALDGLPASTRHAIEGCIEFRIERQRVVLNGQPEDIPNAYLKSRYGDATESARTAINIQMEIRKPGELREPTESDFFLGETLLFRFGPRIVGQRFPTVKYRVPLVLFS